MTTATVPPITGASKPTATPGATAPNGTPTPGAAVQTPAESPEIAQLRKEHAEYKAKAEGADKKLRVHAIEAKKFADDKKGIGAKLSAHDKMTKAFEAAGLSPEDLMHFKTVPWPALKKALGDGFYDKLVEHRISGGTMTADEVMAVVERGKSEVRSEFETKEQTAKAEREKAAREQDASAREQLTTEAGAFLEKSWAEYPIFEGYERANVARAIASQQEQHWHRTGKVLTAKEAADALETAEYARAERVAAIPKYATKLTEKLKPANTPPVVGSRSAGNTQSERRTLSNDLSASTPQATRTKRTDDERRAAIMALDLARSR